jgi:hypothetical protein
MKIYLVTLLCICSTHQWAMQGHSIVARIAEKKLEKENPEVLKYVFELISSVDLKLPESKQSLLESAAIIDVLNFQYNGFLANSHFMNKEIVYSKDSPNEVKLPNVANPENVVVALNRAVQTIKEFIDKPETLIIRDGFMCSLMMRYLVHLTGDVHQPLHNVSMFSKSLFDGSIIDGDQGGNKIPVNDIFNKNITHLHTLWDDAFNAFDYQALNFPFSDKLKAEIETQADFLIENFPESYFGKKSRILDFSVWTKESIDIAEDFVYEPIEMFPILTPEYVVAGRKICFERMSLAGYRLANKLVELLGSKTQQTDLV